LIFLNPDTIVAPGWWEALVNALEAERGVGAATSKVLQLRNPARVNTAGNDVHLTGLTLCRGMDRPASCFEARAVVSAVSGAAFAIRSDLFRKLGGFDEEYFLYMEDTDLSWRVQLAGYRCLYVPESVVYHDYRLRFGANKTFYQERNRYRMLLKTLRWRTLLALLPALLLAEVVSWGYLVLADRRHWSGKLRAYGSTLRAWRLIRRARRETQSARAVGVGDRQLLGQATARIDFAQTGAGAAAMAADRLFNPLFGLWQRVMMGVVRW
jgi:GT2 family glycosyltransferase